MLKFSIFVDFLTKMLITLLKLLIILKNINFLLKILGNMIYCNHRGRIVL